MGVWLVGVDTGGTFTDLIAVEQTTGELRRAKVPSVSGDPSAAVLDALEKLFAAGINPGDISLFVHGTTVATNALLEGKGVRTGLLITRGFRAVYEARGWSQPRGSDLLDTFYRKPPLLAPQWLTEEVTERLDYRGEVVTPLDEAGLRRSVHRLKAKGVEALAVCFLFSFLNPEHERRAAEIVAEVAPECRISLVVERAAGHPRISAAVDDRDRCLCRADDRRLPDAAGAAADRARLDDAAALSHAVERRPDAHLARRAPSQPDAAVGARGRRDRRRRTWRACTRRRHVITFDMGGTSTDISVIVEGRAVGDHAGPDRRPGHRHADAARCARSAPAAGPSRGSARTACSRSGRAARARSPGPPATAAAARSRPSPTPISCWARSAATPFSPAHCASTRGARARAIETVAKPLGLDVLQGAAGILRIVNTQMAVDLRLALQEQGQDPRKFALVAFGGAGPLHAAALARSVGIPTVLVPPYPGLNCAIGMLQTSVRHSYLKSEVGVLSRFPTGRMNELFRELRAQALAEASEEGFAHDAVQLTRLLDLRYPHQGYTLAGRLSGRHHGRGQGAAQARLRRAASPGLWPVRAEGGRGDRDLPPAGGDRGPAARTARACARRRTRRARLEGRASALRHR